MNVAGGSGNSAPPTGDDGATGLRDKLDPDRHWIALGCAGRVGTARTVRDYITNLLVTTGAARVADLVRGQGPSGRENGLHWVLDGTFQEDHCRLRRGHAARNRAALRRIALSFLMLMQPYVNSTIAQDSVARTPQLEPIMAL